MLKNEALEGGRRVGEGWMSKEKFTRRACAVDGSAPNLAPPHLLLPRPSRQCSSPPRRRLLCPAIPVSPPMLAMTSTASHGSGGGGGVGGDITEAGEWLRVFEAVEGALEQCSNELNDAQAKGIGNRQKRGINKKGTQGREQRAETGVPQSRWSLLPLHLTRLLDALLV